MSNVAPGFCLNPQPALASRFHRGGCRARAGCGRGRGNAYRVKRNDAVARLGLTLADSTRLAALFMPTVHDPAESVLARNLADALLKAAQSDKRILPLGEVRASSMAVELGLEPNTISRDTLIAMARDLGLHTTVSTSVARVGGSFLLSSEARATVNDSALFRVELTAADVAAVPEAIKRLTEQNRVGLVAAFARVSRHKASGKLIGTTPEAARLWTEGLELQDRGDNLAAAEKARASVALDSTFAPGWLTLAVNLNTRACIRMSDSWPIGRRICCAIDCARNG